MKVSIQNTYIRLITVRGDVIMTTVFMIKNPQGLEHYIMGMV